MFSKIKGALDRTIAEEQARHKASTERAASSSPSGATRNNTGSPSKQADPAVFEAAFKLDDDDSDAASRSATPKPAPSVDSPKANVGDTNSEKNPSSLGHAQGQNADPEKKAGAEVPQKPVERTAVPPGPPILTPQMTARLKRMDKLEATYKELLRSYRIAHSRATAIEPFERALREITPLNSISEPDALVEYIGQLNRKSDMYVDELKSVTAEKDSLKKKCDEVDKELAMLKSERDAPLPAGTDMAATGVDDGKDDLFSYDDSMNEQITTLNSEIAALKTELAAARDLEKVARESKKLQDDAQVKLDARDAELKSLKEALEHNQLQVQGLEKEKSELTASYKSVLDSVQQQHDEGKKLVDQNNQLSEKITSLHGEIEAYKKTRAESSVSQNTSVPPPTSAKKNKNKKNKKKGGNSTAPTETLDMSQAPQSDSPDAETLTTELSKLRDEIAQKELVITTLSSKLEAAELQVKEFEIQVGNFSDVAQNHDEAKALIEKLEGINTALESRVHELQEELARRTASMEASTKRLLEYDSVKTELDECKVKLRTFESDHGAIQKIAQDRWKEIVGYKDLIAKIQPELKNLRQESTILKTTREELASLQNEMRTLEKREKDSKKEIANVTRLASDRESEIKLLSERLAAEKTLRTKLEDEKRKLNSSHLRLEGEKNEISAEADKVARRLEAAQSELSGLRPKIKQLEDEVAKLQKEKNLAKDDVDLKTQQYNNAQSLLASMRDQTTELSTRLKEAQSQGETLEEEIAEAQKHLAERTREAETMRRMLADVNERADGKVREMASRMEAAIEERDRIEDESSTLARRRSRENEELKDKVRELEREVKALSNEKDDLEAREREWNRRRLVLEQIEEKAMAETEDIRAIVSSLRSALDASEQQVRDAEKQKADLKKLLDEARNRYEKVNKELKTVQSRLNPGSGSSVASGGRTSMDSTRSGTNGTAPRGGADIAYLKTIFLQFLEVKDEKVRSQLVPVLSKLLGFDKNEDQRWLQAIHRMSKSGK